MKFFGLVLVLAFSLGCSVGMDSEDWEENDVLPFDEVAIELKHSASICVARAAALCTEEYPVECAANCIAWWLPVCGHIGQPRGPLPNVCDEPAEWMLTMRRAALP